MKLDIEVNASLLLTDLGGRDKNTSYNIKSQPKYFQKNEFLA